MGQAGDAIYKTVCPKCGAVRIDNQVGLEETPEEYIDKLVDIFRKVKRVLRDDGILWVNIGDSYSGGGKGRSSKSVNAQFTDKSKIQKGNVGSAVGHVPYKNVPKGTKPKDLIGIPWMLAFALRADGWYLRQDIIWAKNNPMPESVKDRCTRSHEYIFMLTKSRRYYFDHEAIQEPCVSNSLFHGGGHVGTGGQNNFRNDNNNRNTGKDTRLRNKRDVWQVGVCSTVKEAHFAVFPKELIEPCILAGCPKGGTVLDPFSGSGTTGIVATENQRNYIGIDLNPEYMEITRRRVEKECTNAFIVYKTR